MISNFMLLKVEGSFSNKPTKGRKSPFSGMYVQRMERKSLKNKDLFKLTRLSGPGRERLKLNKGAQLHIVRESSRRSVAGWENPFATPLTSCCRTGEDCTPNVAQSRSTSL